LGRNQTSVTGEDILYRVILISGRAHSSMNQLASNFVVFFEKLAITLEHMALKLLSKTGFENELSDFLTM
jgi:hypothetical protein